MIEASRQTKVRMRVVLLKAWRGQSHDAIVLGPEMRHGVSLPHSIQEGMRRLPAGRVGRSSFGFRPATRRNRHLCCVLVNTVGYNFSRKFFPRQANTYRRPRSTADRVGIFLRSWGSGSAGRFQRRETPFSGSAPHALNLSLCKHLSGIGTDKCYAEAEPGATLSLRVAPVPRPAGTEARAGIVPASTPENSTWFKVR